MHYIIKNINIVANQKFLYKHNSLIPYTKSRRYYSNIESSRVFKLCKSHLTAHIDHEYQYNVDKSMFDTFLQLFHIRSLEWIAVRWMYTLTALMIRIDRPFSLFKVDLYREITFRNSKQTYKGIPVMASNMDTIGTFEMAKVLTKVSYTTK